MTIGAALANVTWLGGNLGGWHRYRSALRNVQGAQRTILARYLTRNAATVIGKEYGFRHIRSLAEFRERVPLSRYDDYVPLVQRIMRGEERVLTSDRIRLLQPSSGSTHAAKLIPYTASLQREFRRAVAAWMVDLLRMRPQLLGGPAYWSITPETDRAYPSAARPIGFADDSAYLGGALKQVVDATLAVPAVVRHVRDLDEFRRITLLYLLNAPNLRLISVWHPSYLTLMLTPLQEAWDEFVRDVAGGCHHAAAGVRIAPNPVRARALSRIRPDHPSAIWPSLGLISCWGDGHARTHLPEVSALFPGVDIQAKGLLATEAVVSIPFDGRWPLAVTSHVFEFLDASERAYWPWELEVGQSYAVVVTTGGGLYRYRLDDLVEVTGFLGQAPCLRFLGKTDRVSDLFGEKLSEGFVGMTVTELVERHGLQPRFAMLAPEHDGGRYAYTLFLETSAGLPVTIEADLEAALRENPHYEHCVQLGQLAPARTARIPAPAYERYVGALQADGQRLGDIKPSPLSTRQGWAGIFGIL